jgi:hypothetical protein
MRYQELEKIPGEGMTPSHARYLFLRNITDEKYEMTVKYLRNAGAELSECVTAIRKEERDQLRKRAIKRKLQSTIRRFKDDVSSKDNRKSIYGNDESPPRKVRRLQGEIEVKDNGYLTIPNSQWQTLTDEDKSFVQTYNSKIRHKESVKDLKIPAGVTIKSKARRNQGSTTNELHNDEEEDIEDTTPRKKQKHNGKKVKFSVSHNDDESE